MATKRKDSYFAIAQDYDRLFKVRDEISIVKKLVSKYQPKAKSLLEIACGTGAMLVPFSSKFKISGLDCSDAMLAIAKQRLSKATFYNQDMSNFCIEKRFDVILSLFNSMNHLNNFTEWKGTFKSVAKHLNPKGVFIFDINTQVALRNCAELGAVVEHDNDSYMLTQYEQRSRDSLSIKFSIFKHLHNNNYKLNQSEIIERAYPTIKIVHELKKHFRAITLVNPDKNQSIKEASVIYLVCKN